MYATLLDEGKYLGSIRTLYRVLQENGQARERRPQLRHPRYQAPELLATRPNELWSWDITKLQGPAQWTYFYLYVILDVFSRYVVGWMAAVRESSTLAHHLIEQTCERQGIQRWQLTIHADRGPSMISKPVALLLSDLGVTKTHGCPHVSNDNPCVYFLVYYGLASQGDRKRSTKNREVSLYFLLYFLPIFPIFPIFPRDELPPLVPMLERILREAKE